MKKLVLVLTVSLLSVCGWAQFLVDDLQAYNSVFNGTMKITNNVDGGVQIYAQEDGAQIGLLDDIGWWTRQFWASGSPHTGSSTTYTNNGIEITISRIFGTNIAGANQSFTILNSGTATFSQTVQADGGFKVAGGVAGITADIPVLVPGGTTNLLQFSGGTLTNRVQGYSTP